MNVHNLLFVPSFSFLSKSTSVAEKEQPFIEKTAPYFFGLYRSYMPKIFTKMNISSHMPSHSQVILKMHFAVTYRDS